MRYIPIIKIINQYLIITLLKHFMTFLSFSYLHSTFYECCFTKTFPKVKWRELSTYWIYKKLQFSLFSVTGTGIKCTKFTHVFAAFSGKLFRRKYVKEMNQKTILQNDERWCKIKQFQIINRTWLVEKVWND